MDEGADWAFEGQVLDEEGSALSHLGSQDLVDDEPKARSGIAPEIWAAYNADLRNGWTYVAAVRFTPGSQTSEFVEGGSLFLDLVFDSWPFHKVFLEVPEFGVDQTLEGLEHLFEREAVLKQRSFYQGRYWDQHVYSLTASRWLHAAGSRPRAGG